MTDKLDISNTNIDELKEELIKRAVEKRKKNNDGMFSFGDLGYIWVSEFNSGIAKIILNIDNYRKWGCVDENGKVIVPAEYDFIPQEDFSDGFIYVIVNRKHAVFDITGKIIVPPIYDDVCWWFKSENSLARVRNNHKGGFVDKTGKEIIPLEYEDCAYISIDEDAKFYENKSLDITDLIKLDKQGKSYYYNNQGKLLYTGLDISLVVFTESKEETFLYIPYKKFEQWIKKVYRTLLRDACDLEDIIFRYFDDFKNNLSHKNFVNAKLVINGDVAQERNINNKIMFYLHQAKQKKFNSSVRNIAIRLIYNYKCNYKAKINYPYQSLNQVDTKFMISNNIKYYNDIKASNSNGYYQLLKDDDSKEAIDLEIFNNGYLIFRGLDNEQFLKFAKQEFGISKESLLAEDENYQFI